MATSDTINPSQESDQICNEAKVGEHRKQTSWRAEVELEKTVKGSAMKEEQ